MIGVWRSLGETRAPSGVKRSGGASRGSSAAERFRPPGSACVGVNFFFMIGAWRSLVARLLREQEAGGSNPLAPTIRKKRFARTVDGVVAQPGERIVRNDEVRGSIPSLSAISYAASIF